MTGRDRIVLIVPRRAGGARRRLAAGRLARAQEGVQARTPKSAPRRAQLVDRRRPARERARRAGRVRGRLRLDREPRQSGAAEPGSAVADLPARAGVQPEERRIRLDHRRRLGGSSSSQLRAASARRRRGRRRLHADAVHVRLQRQLLRPRTPLPAAQRLHRAHRLGRPAGQRPPADDPERQARALGQSARRARAPDTADRARSPRPPTCCPPARASTGGATRRSPAGARRPPASTTGASSSPTAPGDRKGDAMNEFFELAEGRPARPAPAAGRGSCWASRWSAAVAYARARRRRLDGHRRRRPTGAVRRTAAAGIAVSQAPTNPNAGRRRDHRRRCATSATAPLAQPVRPAARRRRRRRPPRPPRLGEQSSTAASSARRSSGRRTRPPPSSGGTTTPDAATKPSTPTKPKPKTVYHVAVAVRRRCPPGTTPGSRAADDLQEPASSHEPLPSAKASALIVFRACAAQRQERDLHARRRSDPARHRHLPAERRRSARRSTSKPGQTEQLEYLAAERPARHLRTALVSIAKSIERRATASRRSAAVGTESKAGRELLRRDGLVALPGPALLARSRACSCSPGTPALGAARALGRAARGATALSASK